MDPMFYAVDPGTAMRIAAAKPDERPRRSQWRHARHVEELQRSLQSGQEPHDHLVTGPRRRFGRVTWQDLTDLVLHPFIRRLGRPRPAA